MESFGEYLVIPMNGNSDVDEYPSDTYNINYIAIWSVKEDEEFFL